MYCTITKFDYVSKKTGQPSHLWKCSIGLNDETKKPVDFLLIDCWDYESLLCKVYERQLGGSAVCYLSKRDFISKKTNNAYSAFFVNIGFDGFTIPVLLDMKKTFEFNKFLYKALYEQNPDFRDDSDSKDN